MGLMDSLKGIAGQALGKSAGEIDLLTSLKGIIDQQGGMQGLLAKFKANGLDQVVSSWVSGNNKLPITAEQITKVLGNEQIQALVAKTGLSNADIASKLTTLLPEAVGKLSALSGFLKK